MATMVEKRWKVRPKFAYCGDIAFKAIGLAAKSPTTIVGMMTFVHAPMVGPHQVVLTPVELPAEDDLADEVEAS